MHQHSIRTSQITLPTTPYQNWPLAAFALADQIAAQGHAQCSAQLIDRDSGNIYSTRLIREALRSRDTGREEVHICAGQAQPVGIDPKADDVHCQVRRVAREFCAQSTRRAAAGVISVGVAVVLRASAKI